MNVAVLGASINPEKYSNMAVNLLAEKGHRVFPVNPSFKKIGPHDVYPALSDVPEPVDTLTLYVSRDLSTKLAPQILALRPRRIIFNPGAENAELEAQAAGLGIKTLNACTLVLLKTGQFSK
ncbi:MAG TPA: CoA-binding protein [Candidatus Eisenbacteria bacterium]|jgi:predicted CoA-binding protein|nr:CoA-binding protein [Candidatus Eisenbacteria bacterium]